MGALEQIRWCARAAAGADGPIPGEGSTPIGRPVANTPGSSSHPHAVTSTSNGYSAAYDAAGNLTCRAPNSMTCSGTQTGQQLIYDAEGRLAGWQNQPSSPTSTANYLYDGSGNRVAQTTTVNGTTTLTAYIGEIEEAQTTSGTTQTTTYYAVGSQHIAANVNGTLYYFGYDGLGSQVLVLNTGGNVVGAQLYGPYGSQRCSNGSLPTSIGFTGQRADSVTGLDYYVARYYDPITGMFLSYDTMRGNMDGVDPYSYVGGNPETSTGPTGNLPDAGSGGSPQAPGGGSSNPDPEQIKSTLRFLLHLLVKYWDQVSNAWAILVAIILLLSALNDPVPAEQILQDVLNESGLPTETERTSNGVSSNDILNRIKDARSKVEGKNKEANKFPRAQNHKSKDQGSYKKSNGPRGGNQRNFDKVSPSTNLLQAQNRLEKLNEMNDSSSFAQGAPTYQP